MKGQYWPVYDCGKKPPSKNTSTGLQSLQELEYFNVSKDPELPSAPEQNMIGIIKMSSHQATRGTAMSFFSYFWSFLWLSCTHCKPHCMRTCSVSEVRARSSLLRQRNASFWPLKPWLSYELSCSALTGMGQVRTWVETLPWAPTELYREASVGFQCQQTLFKKQHSFEITFPTISPSFHGSDPENLGYLFR